MHQSSIFCLVLRNESIFEALLKPGNCGGCVVLLVALSTQCAFKL